MITSTCQNTGCVILTVHIDAATRVRSNTFRDPVTRKESRTSVCSFAVERTNSSKMTCWPYITARMASATAKRTWRTAFIPEATTAVRSFTTLTYSWTKNPKLDLFEISWFCSLTYHLILQVLMMLLNLPFWVHKNFVVSTVEGNAVFPFTSAIWIEVDLGAMILKEINFAIYWTSLYISWILQISQTLWYLHFVHQTPSLSVLKFSIHLRSYWLWWVHYFRLWWAHYFRDRLSSLYCWLLFPVFSHFCSSCIRK